MYLCKESQALGDFVLLLQDFAFLYIISAAAIISSVVLIAYFTLLGGRVGSLASTSPQLSMRCMAGLSPWSWPSSCIGNEFGS